MAFSVEIPPPPSVNHAFRNVRGVGRVKTDAYKSWRKLAASLIWAAVRADQRIGGQIIVGIDLPSKTRGDIDNRIKAILDALVDSGRIDDDRNVVELHVGRSRDADTALVVVRAAIAKAAA